jgi:hypothetical protein
VREYTVRFTSAHLIIGAGVLLGMAVLASEPSKTGRFVALRSDGDLALDTKTGHACNPLPDPDHDNDLPACDPHAH